MYLCTRNVLVLYSLCTRVCCQEEKAALEQQMREREHELLPVYRQVAVQFADLHDTAWRMQDKGCINVSSQLLT